MKRFFILFILSMTIAACVSQNTKQIKISSDYISANPNLEAEIKNGIKNGIILPGMSFEQALIAGGVIASEFKNISIWDGYSGGILKPLPGYMQITSNDPFALLVKNYSQYKHSEIFAVYFNKGNVEKVSNNYTMEFSLNESDARNFQKALNSKNSNKLIEEIKRIAKRNKLYVESQRVKLTNPFVKKANGAIYDRSTKLEWVVGPDRPTSFAEANNYIINLNKTEDGWRIPTCDEISTLFKKKSETKLPDLFKNQGHYIWASNSYEKSGTVYYSLDSGCRFETKETGYYNYHRVFAVKNEY